MVPRVLFRRCWTAAQPNRVAQCNVSTKRKQASLLRVSLLLLPLHACLLVAPASAAALPLSSPIALQSSCLDAHNGSCYPVQAVGWDKCLRLGRISLLCLIRMGQGRQQALCFQGGLVCRGRGRGRGREKERQAAMQSLREGDKGGGP